MLCFMSLLTCFDSVDTALTNYVIIEEETKKREKRFSHDQWRVLCQY